MQCYQREHFWNAIVWPVLWPLLLIQAALVLLCVLVGLVVWGLSPSQTSWSTTLWLTLALLLGSCLNVGVFLMLVKSRAKQKDTRFMQELAELERHAATLVNRKAGQAPSKAKGIGEELPLKRLAMVNQLLADVIRAGEDVQHLASSSGPFRPDQTLLDDLHHQQKQLKHLIAGRDRAREESRLKSGYLTLLQREADNLFDHLSDMLQMDNSETCHKNITHVRERLADIRALLTNFVQQSANETDAYEQPLPASERKLRILVVDDGPVNLMLARQMLETQGFHVDGVSSGEQALDCQQTVFYDLVFMDIFMPTLDGLEAARRWRNFERHSGSQRRSVLIALTANVDNAGHGAYNAAGMDDVLAKPYKPETLLSMISKWVPAANSQVQNK
ncbi:MAG TPA: response regulator [Halomonas campaniensis]|uniref:Response regulator n=1 Tax=Halomonas campaniensis TaxID=213554 RepID=A0A3D0KET3_9GAMM|nr:MULTISPECIES: response regulator [unclassified Halomonas]HBS83648.1 response regulator [Halomonas campaniensis]HCA02082.1 response regulator [Halomonas campaniensis]